VARLGFRSASSLFEAGSTFRRRAMAVSFLTW
jgi:hypothetical protein